MAEVGEVFSETKLSVAPENRPQMPRPEDPADGPDSSEHPATQGSEVPARPAPVILRKSLLDSPLWGLIASSYPPSP
jgi:hypothetical protein